MTDTTNIPNDAINAAHIPNAELRASGLRSCPGCQATRLRQQSVGVITTIEELDALPVGSVVIDSGRDVCERMSFGWFGIVKEEGADPWLLSGAEDVPLPATVLHIGDAA